jgi:multidrug efflux pump subunit AcrA (membrane-fusion protein)
MDQRTDSERSNAPEADSPIGRLGEHLLWIDRLRECRSSCSSRLCGIDHCSNGYVWVLVGQCWRLSDDAFIDAHTVSISSRVHQEAKNEQNDPLADGKPSIPTPHERRADPEHLETRPDRPNKQTDADDHDDDRLARSGEKKPKGLKAAPRRHPFAVIICGGLIIIGAIGGFAYYVHESRYESTDDAFIDARPVLVSPQVTGNIIAVYVTDDQLVKKRDLLAKIDPRDYQAAVNQAAAQVEQAEATMTNLDAQILEQQDQIAQASHQVTEAQAAFTFAQEENARYQDLAQTGSGTIERAQQAASDLKSRRASLDAALAAKSAAERQIKVLQAQKQVTAAQRDQYIAQKARADADLSRTELRATVDGRIARLTAEIAAWEQQRNACSRPYQMDVTTGKASAKMARAHPQPQANSRHIQICKTSVQRY